MRRYVLTFLSVFVLAFSMISCAEPEMDSDANLSLSKINANIDDEVQEVFRLTNEFRTGSEASYWNKDNTTKTNLVEMLDELTLDEDLCKAATVRANEIVKKFDHTRPNGKSCFSIVDVLGIRWQALGENIAAGSSTAEGTFLQWKEDDENYARQGHRRNMLSPDFTRIGIAYAYAPNSKYKYYWVMILAK